ncbi:MAG: GrpB family protein [Bacteroidota bacterium]
MKIKVLPYSKEWPNQFKALKDEISKLLSSFDPIIEHFGSTAVPELSAKPVIDILVGIDNKKDFSKIVELLLQDNRYVYYQAFEQGMPERRLFVRIKDDCVLTGIKSIQDDFDTTPHEKISKFRVAHIHIWKFNSPDWIRHIAFRDFLVAHPIEREDYGRLKIKLSQHNWAHGMEYNDSKNKFIKEIEAKAIAWFQKENNSQFVK